MNTHLSVRALLLPVLILSILVVAACNDDTNEEETPNTTTTSSTSTTQSTTTSSTTTSSTSTSSTTTSSNTATSVAPGCNDVPALRRDEEWPEDCSTLDASDEDIFACSEVKFWHVLRTDYDKRSDVFDMFTRIVEAREPSAIPNKGLSRMYFQRGQVAMAMGIEDGNQNIIFHVLPDLDRAIELDPENTILPTWKDSMEIAFANVLSDQVALEAALERAWDNVDLCFQGNVPSISGTTIGLPLSTGAPQRTVDLLREWDCGELGWCDANTWKAPFAAAGLRYHMAEAFARVGAREEAREWLESSLNAPDADVWPYRHIAQRDWDDFDGFLSKFSDLGEDGNGFNIVYANSEFGCKFCHQPAR